MSTSFDKLQIGQKFRIQGQFTCDEDEIDEDIHYWYKATVKDIDDTRGFI